MVAGGRRLSPEERELERKQEELAALTKKRRERELALEKLRGDIASFEEAYARILGGRIEELDAVEARIAAVAEGRNLSFRKFSGQPLREEPAQEPRKESTAPKRHESHEGGSARGLKELYRKVAKAIHPDLSASDEERLRREKMMAAANRAYEEQDRESLQALLQEWECGPDAVKGQGAGAELVRMIRRIALVEDAIRAIEREIQHLKDSELFHLILRVEEARSEGIDMLAEMAAKLDLEISRARRRLFELTGERPGNGEGMEVARLVIFPPDVLLGTLYVRSRGSDNYRDWDRFGDALGTVAVPSGKVLRLDAKECKPVFLQFLEQLNPDDLQALFLYEADDAGLVCLKTLTGLEHLYLGGVGVTDAGLAHLKALTGLRKLYLYDTAITDQGIEALRELTLLRQLTVSDAKISEAGLEELRQGMPSCKIINLKRATGH